jgi:hypothetical protein
VGITFAFPAENQQTSGVSLSAVVSEEGEITLGMELVYFRFVAV